MGYLGNTLGIGNSGGNTGGAGLGFNASGTNLLQPTTTQQATDTYNKSQDTIAQQQAFLQALQAQNGIGNQSNVYNQLQGVANGTGPNPAQAMLNQQTGANVANQASLMAGQRGATANVGLMARQAAQQGAQTQQQAIGQGASMQANQSLGALGQMGNLATQQVGQQAGALTGLSQAAQNEQGMILGGINAQNQANVGIQSSVNSANANVSTAAATGQQKTAAGLAGGGPMAMAAGGIVGGQRAASGAASQTGNKYADGGNVQPSNSSFLQAKYAGASNGATPPPTMGGPLNAPQIVPESSKSQPGAWQGYQNVYKNLQKMFGNNGTGGGGADSGAANDANNYTGNANGSGVDQSLNPDGSLSGTPGGSNIDSGADVGQGADMAGGAADAADAAGEAADAADAASSVGDLAMVAKGGKIPKNARQRFDSGGMAGLIGPIMSMAMAAAEGGKVPALVSPGEVYLKPEQAKAAAKGKVDPIKAGEKIPGKAKVKGNSYANDTVPKTLEEGGLVLPKSVMESKNPHWEAHKFVQAHMGLNAKKKKS